MLESTEKPDIEEIYETSNNSSNLRMDTRNDAPRGAVDVVTAAGMSPSRLGAALMRLHSEYDSGEASHRRKGAGQTDAILMAGRLKTLPAILTEMTGQAREWGMEEPGKTAMAATLWWLDQKCPICRGRQFEVQKGAPVLSSRPCDECKGSGEAKLHYGQNARRLTNFMDDCVQRARQSIKMRLRR